MRRNRLAVLWGCICLGLLLLAACASDERAPTAGTDTPAALPDLKPLFMNHTLANSQCLEPGAPLGVRLTVTNAGSAPAGPFMVRVNGQEQPVDEGLAPGESANLFFTRYAEPSQAEVDIAGVVMESDEANNILQMRLPVPTPPLPCTPTPTAQYLSSLFNLA